MVFFLSFGFLGSILFRGMSWIILKASFFQFITFTLAVVIDAGDLLLVAAHMLAHHLVEVVILVGILFALSGAALLQQVADSVIGVGNRIALVVRHLLEAAKEVQFKGIGSGPVIHLHQFANLVVLIGSLFCPIVVDFLHQIKGCVGILRHITVCIGLGNHVSIPIVDIDGAVTQGINFAGNEVPTIILIQRNFVRVHTIERIHAVEVSRHQLVVFIVAEHRLRSQCVNSEFTIENMYWLSIRCQHNLSCHFKIVHMNAFVGMIPDCQVNGSPAGRTEFC